MEQDSDISKDEEEALTNEIKANGKWENEEAALRRLDESYKFLVSASPGDLVEQFNQLYLLAQQIFQENLELKKKVNQMTIMYLNAQIKRMGFNSQMITDFRRQTN